MLVEKRGRTSEKMQTMINVSDDTNMDYGLYTYLKRRKLAHWQNFNSLYQQRNTIAQTGINV